MAMQTLTIKLHDDRYEKLRARARSSRRSVEEELTDLRTAALPLEHAPPHDLDAAITPLALLNDDALWQVVRIGLPTSSHRRTRSTTRAATTRRLERS